MTVARASLRDQIETLTAADNAAILTACQVSVPNHILADLQDVGCSLGPEGIYRSEFVVRSPFAEADGTGKIMCPRCFQLAAIALE